MEQPSHETNDKFSCFTKITDFNVDNIMQAVMHQPAAFGFGSTEIGLTRVWECLAPLNELLIRRDITQTVNGVLNQFTICDHNERELFAGKDDLSIRVQGHFINIFDNSRSLAMQVKLTTRLWDASYQVLSADGRLMTDITFIFDLCVPMYRMYDDYGSILATFHLLCFSGGFGERHWQV